MARVPRWLLWTIAVCGAIVAVGTVVSLATGEESTFELVSSVGLLVVMALTVWSWKREGRV